MAQGKSKSKQQKPGDSLKRSHKKGGAPAPSKGVNKKKTEPRGGAKHNVSATTSMKTNFQKAINARIEVEVSQRARACESKSFTILKPGESSTSGSQKQKGKMNPKSSSTLPSVKGTLKATSKRLAIKAKGKPGKAKK